MTDDLIKRLDALHAAGKMHGFSVWPSQGGYQASLGMATNSFRIRHAATPGAAIAELLQGDGPLELLPDNQPDLFAPPDVDEPELPPLDESVFD